MRKAIATAAVVLTSLLSHTATAEKTTFEVMSSTSSYNRLVFPIPFEKIVIPNDAQLHEKPITLKDNLGVLIRPLEGARPIDVFIQLVDGKSFNLRLIPSADPEGAVFRYEGATDAFVKPESADRAGDGWIADAFVLTLQGKEPLGFSNSTKELMPIKAVIRKDNTGEKHAVKELNQIDLKPLKKLVGSGHVITVYRLYAKQMVNIEPRDFYRDGVVAISIDGDVVGREHNPVMVVLEKSNGN